MYLSVGGKRPSGSGFVHLGRDQHADVRWDHHLDLPFADGAFEEVRCESGWDSMPTPDAVAFLRECRRVTQIGGRVHLATGGLAQSQILDEAELTRCARIAGLEIAAGERTAGGPRSDVELVHDRPAVQTEPPLVSILIPAYRSSTIGDALRSARAQQHPNLEIVVSDDSPGSEVHPIVEEHRRHDDRIVYVRNPPPGGSRSNHYHLFELATGAYIKYLNDDDVLHPQAVERLAAVLMAHPRVTLATSHRERVDEIGNPLPDDVSTTRPFSSDSFVSGPSAVHNMLSRGINWIGEPTTAMFRRADVTDVEPELFAFGGRAAITNGDMTLWTRLLARGDLCYLTTSLSLFRQHDSQVSADPEQRRRSLDAWRQLSVDAERHGLMGARSTRPIIREMGLRPWWSPSTTSLVVGADEALEEGDALRALEMLGDARRVSEGDPSVADLEARLADAVGSASAAREARAAIGAFNHRWRRPLTPVR